ncbi:MAG: hypothetical protein R3B59_03775 [Dehalococcoidia bacterium]
MRAFDSWMKRASRAGVLLAVLVFGVALVACGGGDDEDGGGDATSTPTASSGTGGATATATTASGSTATATAAGGSTPTATASGGSTNLGTEQGNRIATAAMLVESDLPGTGWTVISTDDFEGSLLSADDTEFANTPACSAYVKKVTDAAKKAEAARIGRAARGFQEAGALFGTSIDVEVTVFKDSGTASSLVSEARGAFGSADFEACFREVIKGSEGDIPEEVEFDLKAGKPLTSAPHNGVAQAFDISLSSAGISFALHAELYAWADKNAVAFVSIFGAPDEIKEDAVKAAVSKTDQKLSAAQ